MIEENFSLLVITKLKYTIIEIYAIPRIFTPVDQWPGSQ